MKWFIPFLFLPLLIAPIERRDFPSTIERVRYENFSTDQSMIEVRIQDTVTQKVYSIVVGNRLFYTWYHAQFGMDRTKYLEMMAATTVFMVKIDELAEYLTGIRDKDKALFTFSEKYVVIRQLEFEDLGVDSEEDLILTYFQPWELGGYVERRDAYVNALLVNPDCMSFLLGLGFNVIRGDAGMIFLKKP